MIVLSFYHYWVFITLLMMCFYTVIVKQNLVKKLLGLSLFQSAVFLLFIGVAKVTDGTTPILHPDVTNTIFSTPLPQVLILTAIVVGISTSALGLAIIVRIKEAYGTIEEDEIRDQDSAQ